MNKNGKIIEKRKKENGPGRRSYDGGCPVHDICMGKMDKNTEDIEKLEKRINALIAIALVSALTASGSLLVLVLTHVLEKQIIP